VEEPRLWTDEEISWTDEELEEILVELADGKSGRLDL